MTPASATLTVLDPGLHTLVVDEGRPASRSLGVAVGGAADRFALALGNAVVGNPPGSAALEITLRGPTLCADRPLACALFGAPFDLTVDGRRLLPNWAFTLEPGAVLRIGGTPRGLRAYLCVRGGLQMPPILGSRSGLAPLTAGAALPCCAGTIVGRSLHLGPNEGPYFDLLYGPAQDVIRLAALDGPQADWFDPGEFFGESRVFTVTAASNRMGLRLAGEPLRLPERELVSEPVAPGAVQVTRDGQCILLGVDGQTIGGYPKVAHVIAADLDRVGQLRPGDRVGFERVGMGQAEERYRRRAAVLREWLTRLTIADVRAIPGLSLIDNAPPRPPGTGRGDEAGAQGDSTQQGGELLLGEGGEERAADQP